MAVRRNAVELEAAESDDGPTGDAARARPSSVVAIGGEHVSSTRSERVLVRRYRDECHLDRLHSMELLDDRQWRAGMLFRRFWRAVVREPRVSASYCPPVSRGGDGGDAAAVTREGAAEALREAYGAMGKLDGATVTSVAGMDETCARRLHGLRNGLDALAVLWDVPADYRRSPWR